MAKVNNTSLMFHGGSWGTRVDRPVQGCLVAKTKTQPQIPTTIDLWAACSLSLKL